MVTRSQDARTPADLVAYISDPFKHYGGTSASPPHRTAPHQLLAHSRASRYPARTQRPVGMPIELQPAVVLRYESPLPNHRTAYAPLQPRSEGFVGRDMQAAQGSYAYGGARHTPTPAGSVTGRDQPEGHRTVASDETVDRTAGQEPYRSSVGSRTTSIGERCGQSLGMSEEAGVVLEADRLAQRQGQPIRVAETLALAGTLPLVIPGQPHPISGALEQQPQSCSGAATNQQILLGRLRKLDTAVASLAQHHSGAGGDAHEQRSARAGRS